MVSDEWNLKGSVMPRTDFPCNIAVQARKHQVTVRKVACFAFSDLQVGQIF